MKRIAGLPARPSSPSPGSRPLRPCHVMARAGHNADAVAGEGLSSRVWRHSQIAGTCYLGVTCMAGRGGQRPGSLPPLP